MENGSTLHQKIREFESRIRKWRQLRFGFAVPCPQTVVTRRSTSQQPRKPSGAPPSATCSPAHRNIMANNMPAGSSTSPLQRKNRDLGLNFQSCVDPRQSEKEEIQRRYDTVMANSGKLNIMGKVYENVQRDDLEWSQDIGHGSCGQVARFQFKHVLMAVKIMARTNNPDENKRIIMDLGIISKAGDCPHIVRCYGYLIFKTEVFICMELMATCLDRVLKRTDNRPFPERIVGKMIVSIIEALDYLKDKHNVIHRDVKPSNILMDWRGTVKLCDFGISGQLIGSRAHSAHLGCPPYMAPERFKPESTNNYDIRSDVWSLGITLVEIATGRYPYKGNEFEILTAIIDQPPPVLSPTDGFSPTFCDFVGLCLQKDPVNRPKYKGLLDHQFIKKSRADDFDVGESEWFNEIMGVKESSL